MTPTRYGRMTTNAVSRSSLLSKSLVTPPLGLKIRKKSWDRKQLKIRAIDRGALKVSVEIAFSGGFSRSFTECIYDAF